VNPWIQTTVPPKRKKKDRKEGRKEGREGGRKEEERQFWRMEFSQDMSKHHKDITVHPLSTWHPHMRP
jgi:hypothetical protein